jgi:hypothetical protein
MHHLPSPIDADEKFGRQYLFTDKDMDRVWWIMVVIHNIFAAMDDKSRNTGTSDSSTDKQILRAVPD